MRAQGRVLQAILRCVDELSSHRGCQPSKLGAALVAILRPPVGASGADVTRVDIDMGEAEENAEPAHDDTALVGPEAGVTAAFAQIGIRGLSCPPPYAEYCRPRGADSNAYASAMATSSMTSSRRSGDEVEAEHNAASSQGPPPASFPSVMEKEGDEAAPSTHVRGPAVEAGDAAQGVGKKKNKSLRKRAHAAAEAALQALLVDHKQTAAASKRVIMRRHRCGLPCLPLLEALDARMHKQALAVISAIKAHGVAMDALAAAHAAGGAAAPADAAAERARAVLQECVQEHRTILADIMAAVAKEEATAASADEPHAAVSPV